MEKSKKMTAFRHYYLLWSALVLFIIVVSKHQLVAQSEEHSFQDILVAYRGLPSEAQIDSFFQKIEAYTPSIPNKPIYHKLCWDAINYGEANGENQWSAAGYGGMSYIHFRERASDSLAQYIDKALFYTRKATYSSAYVNFASLKLISLAWQKDTEAATLFSKETAQWINANGINKFQPYYLSKFFYNSSLFFYNSNDLLNAMPDVLLAEEYARRSTDSELLARTLGLKATILEASGEKDALSQSLKESANIYFQKRTPIDSLRAFAKLMHAEQEFMNATCIFEQSQPLAIALLDTAYLEARWLYTSLLHYMSEHYESANQKTAAIQMRKTLIQLYPDEYIPERFVIISRLELANHYLNSSKPTEAAQLAERVIQESQKFNDQKIEAEAHLILSKALLDQGLTAKAASILESALRIEDELNERAEPDQLLKKYLH